MLTKKNLIAIRKIIREEIALTHLDVHKGLQSIDKKLDKLMTKQDIQETMENVRKDIQELTKYLRMYMELTKVYREKQTILEKEFEDLLIDLGYSEN